MKNERDIRQIITRNDFSKIYGVDRSKVDEATNALDIELPTEVVGYNEAKVIDQGTEELIVGYLGIINPQNLIEERKRGSILSNELAKDLNTSNARISVYLKEIYSENWSDGLCTAPSGHRRVFVIPLEMRTNLKRYHNLSHERQMLGVWRSMKIRGTMDFTEYLYTPIDQITKRRLWKIVNYGIIAEKILKSADIIKLDENDTEMLYKLSAIDLSIKYEYLLDVVFRKSGIIRERQEVFNYMRLIIGKLRYIYKSEGDFTAMLFNSLVDFGYTKKTN